MGAALAAAGSGRLARSGARGAGRGEAREPRGPVRGGRGSGRQGGGGGGVRCPGEGAALAGHRPPRMPRCGIARTPCTGRWCSPRSSSGAASTRWSATRRSWAARRSPARSGRLPRVPGRGDRRGKRGSADLVAYFVLRAHELLTRRPDRADRHQHARAGRHPRGRPRPARRGRGRDPPGDEERAWPSRVAVLEYCAVWTSRAPVDAARCWRGRGRRRHHRVARRRGAVDGQPYGWRRTPTCRSRGRTCWGWASLWSPRRRSAHRRGPAQRRRAVSVPQRPGPQLAPGLCAEPLGHQLPRLAGGAGAHYLECFAQVRRW